MVYILSGLLNWLRGLFFAKHLEVTIVGLQVCPIQFYTCGVLMGIGKWENIVSHLKTVTNRVDIQTCKCPWIGSMV